MGKFSIYPNNSTLKIQHLSIVGITQWLSQPKWPDLQWFTCHRKVRCGCRQDLRWWRKNPSHPPESWSWEWRVLRRCQSPFSHRHLSLLLWDILARLLQREQNRRTRERKRLNTRSFRLSLDTPFSRRRTATPPVPLRRVPDKMPPTCRSHWWEFKKMQSYLLLFWLVRCKVTATRQPMIVKTGHSIPWVHFNALYRLNYNFSATCH